MDLLQYRKAIVAVLSPIITGLILKFFSLLGLEFTTDVSNAIVVILTGTLVYLVPNKAAN